MTQFSLDARVIQSPGGQYGDLKDQDRARWHDADRVACVCDGLTTSPYADRAASYVVDRAPTLFAGTGALGRMAKHLRAMRRRASQRPVSIESTVPANLLEDIVRSQMQHAYQTTLVAFRVGQDGEASWIRVGDSDLLVVDSNGDHRIFTGEARADGGRTLALPDHHRRAETGRFVVGDGWLVVIGSDGFFSSLDQEEVPGWCRHGWDHVDLERLHERLRQTGGDDDISAVIVDVKAGIA